MTEHKMHDMLLAKKGVVSVGNGYKIRGGIQEAGGLPCVVVGVVKKFPKDQVSASDLVPERIDGRTTDVIETGEIRAQEQVDRVRPLRPGFSIGHAKITAGTLGFIATQKATGERVMVSNNHIFANSNDAVVGDIILQPGRHDGGTVGTDRGGELQDFVPIDFGQQESPPICQIAKGAAKVANVSASIMGRTHRLSALIPGTQGGDNKVDCAIAVLVEGVEMSDDIEGIGVPTGTKEATLRMPVQKSGRTTGYTTGIVMQVNASVNVNYGNDRIALFRGQIMTGPMSAGGDSGSALLDMEGNIVGLLYAGSDQTTIYNQIDDVMEALGLSL